MPYYFGNEYATAMDREKEYNVESSLFGEMTPSAIGVSTPPMKEQLESLKARIFQGASRVELGFMGVSKGSMAQGATTPEMYGKEEREAIRELSKVNKIELSTHAAPAAQGFSGFDPEQGRFSDESRQRNLFEIQRAIDFAADTAGGGPVVAHLGEWHRPMFRVVEKYGGKFEAYPEEEKKAPIYLADTETDQIFSIKKDMKVWEPIVKEIKKDPLTGKEFEVYEYNPDGTIKLKEYTFDEIVEIEKKKDPKISPEEAFIKHHFDTQYKRAHAEALRYAKHAAETRNRVEQIKKEREYWEKFEQAVPEKERWKLKHQFEERTGRILPPEIKTPSQFYKELEEESLREIKWTEEYSIAMGRQAEETKKMMERARPIEEVGITKSAEGLARAAMYAYEVEKKKGLEKPVFIAPENLYPEGGYGSHPQELKEIIQKSRERMMELLKVQKGLSEEEARKVAEQHIKATFDIGHATNWRKFFKGTDEEFKKWVIGQVKDLVKSGIIGHIHISDNFGYYDEHVTPGQGIAPIKEFVEEVKKAGIKSVIVEPAHQDYKALLGAWKEFGSTIYAALAPYGLRGTWTDIEFSYFGRTRSPNYLVGDIRPSDDWVLWSGVPLE